MNSPSKVVMALSGGLDSSTMLAYLINLGYDVECINFVYGSQHNKYEIDCAQKIAKYYKVPYKLFDLTSAFLGFRSNLLLDNNKEIPEGHYENETMSKTVVPGRNSIFAMVLMGYAESIDAGKIALGVHRGDHCVPEDELIITEYGKLPIKWVEKNMKVLSQNLKTGEISYQKILKKINNGLRKDIYKITTKGGRSVELTGNHKVFVIERYGSNPTRNGWKKRVIERKVEDLYENDFILTPSTDRKLFDFNKAYDLEYIDLLPYCDHFHINLKYDETQIWFKKNNKVNRFVDQVSFIKLLAWFISEGNKSPKYSKRANTYRVGIPQSLEKNNDNYNEIIECVKNWGFNICQSGMDNNETIYFSGPTTYIFNLCGNISFDKKIPTEFLFIDPQLLLDTLIKGDGSINKTNPNYIQYGTSSYILKEQICWLATNLGYSVGVNKNKIDHYSINIRHNFKKKMNKFGDARLTEIKEIKKINPKIVYDLEIENNHNFFAGKGSGLLVSNSIYPDCRLEYIKALDTLVYLASDKKIEVISPFIDIDKIQICKRGIELKVPFQFTRTCYKNCELSCGKCGSCIERLEAFKINGIPDPIQYEQSDKIKKFQTMEGIKAGIEILKLKLDNINVDEQFDEIIEQMKILNKRKKELHEQRNQNI